MKTIVSIATVLAVVFIAVSPALAHEAGETYGMGPWMMNWGYGMGWHGSAVMVVVWIALTVGAVLLVRWLMGFRHTGEHRADCKGESACEILEKRYARGEIDKDEFERIKKDIPS